MREFLITLATLCSLASPLEARIGDAEAEIRAHYGEAVAVLTTQTNDPGVVKCYSWNGYIVSVTYVAGRSVREIFTKANSSQITEAEMQRALKANAGGSKWQAEEVAGPKNTVVGVREWRSEEGSRVAFYDSSTGALFISTQRFVDLIKATQRDILKRNVTGLQNPRVGARPLGGAPGRALRSDHLMDKIGAASRQGQSQPSASPASK